MTSSKRLRDARARAELVRISSPYEDGSSRGYVLDVGTRHFLVSVVGGDLRFDGFRVLRIADARGLRPDPYATFVEAALRKRRQRVRRAPRIDLSSLDRTLLSAARLFPLVTMHRERVDADVCHVGRVVRVERGRVALLEIGPGAEWDTEATEHKLSEITRVDFGGGYEEALWLVGGPGPRFARTLATAAARRRR